MTKRCDIMFYIYFAYIFLLTISLTLQMSLRTENNSLKTKGKVEEHFLESIRYFPREKKLTKNNLVQSYNSENREDMYISSSFDSSLPRFSSIGNRRKKFSIKHRTNSVKKHPNSSSNVPHIYKNLYLYNVNPYIENHYNIKSSESDVNSKEDELYLRNVSLEDNYFTKSNLNKWEEVLDIQTKIKPHKSRIKSAESMPIHRNKHKEYKRTDNKNSKTNYIQEKIKRKYKIKSDKNTSNNSSKSEVEGAHIFYNNSNHFALSCNVTLKNWSEKWQEILKDNDILCVTDPHWLRFDPPIPIAHIILTILYVIFMIVGCLGNGLVIYLFSR